MLHESSLLKRPIKTITRNGQEEEFIEDEPRHNKRTKTSKSFGLDFLTCLLKNDPQSFKETMSSPEAPY